ncbi:hypothetical protein MTO96_003204 [Rhipicephalus appendiculatus]
MQARFLNSSFKDYNILEGISRGPGEESELAALGARRAGVSGVNRAHIRNEGARPPRRNTTVCKKLSRRNRKARNSRGQLRSPEARTEVKKGDSSSHSDCSFAVARLLASGVQVHYHCEVKDSREYEESRLKNTFVK